MKKSKQFGIFAVAAVWLTLCVMAWFWPRTEISNTERRKLAQFPSSLSEKYPSEFDAASLDQFPLRDRFRQLKALTCYDVFCQRDNNGIYLEQGYAAKLDYPLNDASLRHGVELLQQVNETFLAESQGRIFLAVVPDKGYFLAEAGGYPAMDYDTLMQTMERELPFAQNVNLTGALSQVDYYRTDTHWKQENLFPAAKVLCDAMGISAPNPADFTKVPAEQPFYGVYYGQAALPMEPDSIVTMENAMLADCKVFNLETNREGGIYDYDKLDSRDPYEVYLSGASALLTIDNPAGDPERELVVFRDSFGSSLIPLLIGDYGKVTVVDLRYLPSVQLENYVNFHGQDILLLYSTLILNNSFSMK